MFEQFTDRARRVVVQAQDEARRLGHRSIGSEDLLLSLIHESIGGVAATVLESLRIDLATVRQRVEETACQGEGVISGYVPFAPHAKDLLPQAVRESRALGHDYVGTEHLLLGLIAADGVAAQVLTGLGVTLDEARAQVLRLLDEHRP